METYTYIYNNIYEIHYIIIYDSLKNAELLFDEYTFFCNYDYLLIMLTKIFSILDIQNNCPV